MTENKQFKIEFDGHRYFLVIDEVNERCLARLDTMQDAHAWLEIYEMLSDENKQIKHIIQEAYNNERTKLGQSVLKQLINNIEVK